MGKGRMIEWESARFAEWLRVARARKAASLTQRQVARDTGLDSRLIGRWEKGEQANPPHLGELIVLADYFGADFRELAQMVGQWDNEIERRMLASIATAGVRASGAMRKYLSSARSGNVIYLPMRPWSETQIPDFRPIHADLVGEGA